MRHLSVQRGAWLVVLSGALAPATACVHHGGASDDRPSAAQLDSIRLAADDAQARRRLNSGLQAVDITDSDRNRFTRVEQMIQAKFSGVIVSQNGAGYAIRIRGSDSFQGGVEPLIIVDGATMNGVADLASVNPHDVVRIEVLKDAAASLYGLRGGNGVIVISTRRIP